MPPQSADQLTDGEMKALNEWANDGEVSQTLEEFCSKTHSSHNPKVFQQIISDRKVFQNGRVDSQNESSPCYVLCVKWKLKN